MKIGKGFMESLNAGGHGSGIEMRNARASSVIVHRIPGDQVGAFVAWERGITGAASGFAGYQGTEVYPASGGGGGAWVVIVHFENAAGLEAWLGSGVRGEWMEKLPAEIRDFEIKTLESGFGAWLFGGGGVAHWKMWLAVLLGLYPTVMVLQIFLSAHLGGLGVAGAMLVGNAASVAFLEWLGMPVISRVLAPWLKAGGVGSVVGLVGIVVLLLGMVWGFGWVVG